MKTPLWAIMLCVMLSNNSAFCSNESPGCADAKRIEVYKKEALNEFFRMNLLAATTGAVLAVFKVSYNKISQANSYCPCLFDKNVSWGKCGKIALIGGGIGAGLYTTLKIFGISDASIRCFFKELLSSRHHSCCCHRCDSDWYIVLDGTK